MNNASTNKVYNCVCTDIGEHVHTDSIQSPWCFWRTCTASVTWMHTRSPHTHSSAVKWSTTHTVTTCKIIMKHIHLVVCSVAHCGIYM